MGKWVVLAAVFFVVLAFAGFVETAEKGSEGRSAAINTAKDVETWGEAILIIKDDKGNVLSEKSERYPIPGAGEKAEPFNNCWDWCRRVCDGYGVCWLSCGWHCNKVWVK